MKQIFYPLAISLTLFACKKDVSGPVVPQITTTDITDISNTTAISGGTVVATGGATVTDKGVCYSTSPTPTTNDSKTTNSGVDNIFVSYISGLTPNTQYYVRAYATNTAGTAYGSTITFTTNDALPKLATTPPVWANATSAKSGGEVQDDRGSSILSKGVCWSTSPGPTIANNKTNDGNGKGGFTSTFNGLMANTTYYVRAYATSSIGTGYGNELSFYSGLSTEDRQYVNSETAAFAHTSETVDIARSVISNVGDGILGATAAVFPTGTLQKWDKRLKCATVSVTQGPGSTIQNPTGTITISYDSTSTCLDTTSVQRKGTITVKYNGLRFAKGSTAVLTYQSYSRNGVKIKGIYSVTNATDSTATPLGTINTLTGGQITFPDGGTVTRTETVYEQWNPGTSLFNGSHSYYGPVAAQGIMKDGTPYSSSIMGALVSSVSCQLNGVFIITTSGTKSLQIGLNYYEMDYGFFGACDNNLYKVYSHGAGPYTVTANEDGN